MVGHSNFLLGYALYYTNWVSYHKKIGQTFWLNLYPILTFKTKCQSSFFIWIYRFDIHRMDLGDLPWYPGVFGASHSWKLNTQKPANQTMNIAKSISPPPPLPHTKNNNKTKNQLTWHQTTMISSSSWGSSPFFNQISSRNGMQELMDLAPGPQLNGFLLYQQKQRLG